MFFTVVDIPSDADEKTQNELIHQLSQPYRGQDPNTILTTHEYAKRFQHQNNLTLLTFDSVQECLTHLARLPYECGRVFLVTDDPVNHPDVESIWSIDSPPLHRWSTDEEKYLELVRSVRDHGEYRMDRTGTGVRSLFGPQIEFDLEKGFPLLTTKRVPFDKVVHEVMWYLSGDTDTAYLRANRVFVWDDNTSRAFLDARGLSNYKVGQTGPLYGFQWRHFGGDMNDLKRHPGVDQLTRILHILRTDPTSRRMYLSAWNPVDLDKMCLEPCHVSFQLFVRNGTHLDGKLYLRSNDLFLGAPWNIAAYALLLTMFGHLSGYTPGRLIYTLGDAHLYETHLSAVGEMLQRPPRPLPRVTITNDRKHPLRGWDDFSFEHFQLIDYTPHPPIAAKMAV